MHRINLKYHYLIGLILLSLSACSEYQKVYKSDEIKPKYDMALAYYEDAITGNKPNKLKKTVSLLEQILPQYRGTPQGERVAYIYADAYYRLGDYFISSYQFERFAKAYPKSSLAEDAYYKSAKSNYELSPIYSKDQTETKKAIQKLQDYIVRYPDGQHIAEANVLVQKLRVKLEKKAFEIAKLYYNIGDYKEAIAAFTNFIEKNPGSPFTEQAYFYKLNAAYSLAIKSYSHLIKERLEIAKEYLNDYRKYYSDGTMKNEVQKISNDIEKRLNEFEQK